MKRPLLLISLGLFFLFQARFAQSQAAVPQDTFSQAMALFEKKQYAEAIPLWEKAAGERTDQSKAFYYWAYCQKLTGDLKGATLHFYQSDQRRPTPAIRAYADKLKEQLSLEDQAWVEEGLTPKPAPVFYPPTDPPMPAPSSGAAGHPASAVPAPVEFLSGRFGLRASMGFDFWSLPDIDSEGQELFDFAQSEKTKFPGTIYDKTSPLAGLFLEVNAFAALEEGELGAKFNYYFSNHFLFRITDSQYPAYFDETSVDFDSFGAAASGRLYFKIAPRVRFYLEPSLGFQNLHLVFNIHYAGTSGTPSAATYGFEADGASLAGGLMLGYDFLIGKRFGFSFAGGYNYARFGNLKGRFVDPSFPGRNNIAGQAVMVRSPVTGERYIWFRPDDASLDYHFYNSAIGNYDLRPMVIDLSAVRFTAAFSVLF